MNININVNNKTLRSVSQNIQGDRSQIVSSMQIITTAQHAIQQQQQPGKKTKKPKCRGNGKIQRYRRQLYAQGLDSVTVTRLIEEKFHPQVQEQQHVGEESVEAKDRHNMDVSIRLKRVCF